MAIKSTAINQYNTAAIKQSGRVGTIRYVQRNGQTYVRSAKNSKVTNDRTVAQMTQRMKFASLVGLYGCLAEILRGAFTTKQANQSDYNAFIKANQGRGVYIGKDEKELGKVIAFPVIMARGVLQEIKVEVSGSKVKSNLSVGVGNPSTIKALADALVINNTGWKYGDQLTIVVIKQDKVNKTCEASYCRIVLDKTNSDALPTAISFVDGKLAVSASDAVVGMIHSNSKGEMSPADSVEIGLTSFIAGYKSDATFEAARLTYGESKANVLRPNGVSDAVLNSGNIQGGNQSQDSGNQQQGSGNENQGGSSQNTGSGSKTLTLNVAPSAEYGTVSGAGTYTTGSEVTITATANTGYRFSKWSDDDTNASRSFTLNEDKTLTAQFVTASEARD